MNNYKPTFVPPCICYIHIWNHRQPYFNHLIKLQGWYHVNMYQSNSQLARGSKYWGTDYEESIMLLCKICQVVTNCPGEGNYFQKYEVGRGVQDSPVNRLHSRGLIKENQGIWPCRHRENEWFPLQSISRFDCPKWELLCSDHGPCFWRLQASPLILPNWLTLDKVFNPWASADTSTKQIW